MTDPFVDVEMETAEGTDSMSSATEPTSGLSASNPVAPVNGNGGANADGSVNHHPPQPASPQTVREFLVGKHVCPFCGTPNPIGTQPCPRCTMEDTPATRQATKSRIGPWYVLQSRNPAAPGMRFSTLLALVQKGQVSPRSVVRGPTTHQLWRFAAHVRGLSREFGLCYSCGEAIDRASNICPHCERSQEPPNNPDLLLEIRETNGAAHANGGAPAGNGAHAAVRGPTREYELPARPAAYPPPARAPRGEHAERLRLLNAEGNVSRARPELRRDGRTLSAMELASALQHQPSEEGFEEGTSRFGRVVGVLVLIILVGGGVFLYLNPEYRNQTGAWVSEHWRTARSKVNAFEVHKPAPQTTTDSHLAGSPKAPLESPGAAEPLVGADAARVASDRAGNRPDLNTAATKPINDGGNRMLAGAGAAPTTNPAAPTPTTMATAQPKDVIKPDKKQQQASNPRTTQPDDNNAGTNATARQRAGNDTSQPPKQPDVAIGPRHDEEPPARIVQTMTVEEAREKARSLRTKAIDAEVAKDWPKALRLWEEIKNLPKAAWPGDLELQIEYVKGQIDQK